MMGVVCLSVQRALAAFGKRDGEIRKLNSQQEHAGCEKMRLPPNMSFSASVQFDVPQPEFTWTVHDNDAFKQIRGALGIDLRYVKYTIE